MTTRPRLLGALLIALALVGATGYTGWRWASTDRARGAAPLDLDRPGTLLYVDDRDGRTRQVSRDAPEQVVGVGPACVRAYAAGGTLSCLRTSTVPGGFEVAIFPRGLAQPTVLDLWGTPSRTRVSTSGRLVAWTVFRSGDSYMAGGAFSTTAGVYDLATRQHYGSLEDFTAVVDGQRFTAENRNFWGITFAADDRTFYATMASGDRTWLMRGDLGARRLEAVRDNVECPSLSPNGDRLAYKQRVDNRWRLHVLHLDTGADTALAETGHVDDQPAWLDPDTVAYARPVDGHPAIFAVPADGSGQPRRLRAGSSPGAPR